MLTTAIKLNYAGRTTSFSGQTAPDSLAVFLRPKFIYGRDDRPKYKTFGEYASRLKAVVESRLPVTTGEVLQLDFQEAVMAAQNHTRTAPVAFTISDVAIRQDDQGRYCLNDLHRAAGNHLKQRPQFWLSHQQTKDLIAELEKDGIPSFYKTQGRKGSTYVVKELVYAYAAWISASFNLKVIRAYDALTTAKPEPANLDINQLSQLVRQEIANALPMTGYLLPPNQAKEITDRLNRLSQLFHPLSPQFGDVLGIARALRGLHPNLGLQEPGYRKVIEHPADRADRRQ